MSTAKTLFQVLSSVIAFVASTTYAAESKPTTPLPGAAFVDRFVEVDGYQIRYMEAGSGPVLISLPGSAGLEMSVAKDELAKSFRVIEFDPPGWGTSPELQGKMTQKQLAKILAKAIDKLGIERYTLMGTSLGGTNALWVAVDRPNKVSALIMEGPMAFVQPKDMHVTPEQGAAMQKRPAGGPGTSAAPIVYPVPEGYGRKTWATPQYVAEQMRRRMRMFAHVANDPADAKELAAKARELKVPALVLVGTKDEIIKPSVEESWKQNMPEATFKLISDGTHDIQNTQPEAFVENVTAFIAKSR